MHNKFSELFKIGGSVSKRTELLVGIIGSAILLLLWYSVTYTGTIIPKSIFPNPVDVLLSYPRLLMENALLINAWATIKLNIMSYVYALILAIPCGFIIGMFPVMNALFSKYIDAIRYTPMGAMTGVFLAIFGLSFTMKANFLAFGIFIYILPAVVNKVQQLQNPSNAEEFVFLQTIKTLGASDWQKFRYVYFPHVMRQVSADIINLTAISYTYITIIEVVNKDLGIGCMIRTMGRQSDTASVFALLFLIIIIGICQDQLLKFFDKLLFPSKYNRKKLGVFTWMKNQIVSDKPIKEKEEVKS